MTMRVYASTDASAPVLTGQAGSLVALLKAILVDGYGSLTAAGWTEPFTAANKGVFRPGAGSQYYLDVDDTNGGATGSTRVAGYVTMSAVATGTGRFPAAATFYSWVKSNTTDATARPWFAYADDKRIWLFIQAGITSFTTKWCPCFFGDFFAVDTAWAARCTLLARIADWNGTLSSSHWNTSEIFPGTAGEWQFPEKYSGGAVFANRPVLPCYTTTLTSAVSSVTLGVYTAGLAYPHTPSGGIVVAQPVLAHQSPNLIIGHVPGLWVAGHNGAGADQDTFTGSGALSGKSFKRYDLMSAGNIWIETSDTWT